MGFRQVAEERGKLGYKFWRICWYSMLVNFQLIMRMITKDLVHFKISFKIVKLFGILPKTFWLNIFP